MHRRRCRPHSLAPGWSRGTRWVLGGGLRGTCGDNTTGYLHGTQGAIGVLAGYSGGYVRGTHSVEYHAILTGLKRHVIGHSTGTEPFF